MSKNNKSPRPIIFMNMTSGQDISSYCNSLSQSKVLYNKLVTGGNDPTKTNSSRFTSLANNGKFRTITQTNLHDYNVPNPPNNLSASGNSISKTLSVSFTAPNKLITYTIQIYDNYGNLVKQINTDRTSYIFNSSTLYFNNLNNPNLVVDLINNGYSVAVTANINNGIYLGNTYQIDSSNMTTDINSNNSLTVAYTFTPPIQEQQLVSYYTLTLFNSNGKIVQKTRTDQTNYTFNEVSSGTYTVYVTATNNNGTSGKNSSIQNSV
jgi:ribose 5-phosphate isomerase RpiB